MRWLKRITSVGCTVSTLMLLSETGFFCSGLSFCFRFEPECNTSDIEFKRSKAGIPSSRNPALRQKFQHRLTCVTHMSASCTYNLLEKMCDFRIRTMFHLNWILSLRDLLQSQNLELIPIDIVVQCFPLDNIVCNHLCNECKRSNALNVCHIICSIL